MVEGPVYPGEPRPNSALARQQEYHASRLSIDHMPTRDRWMVRLPSAVADRNGADRARAAPAPAPLHPQDTCLSSLPAPGLPPPHPTEVSPGATSELRFGDAGVGATQEQILLQREDGLTQSEEAGERGQATRGGGGETGDGDDKDEDVDALLKWTQLLDFDRFARYCACSLL